VRFLVKQYDSGNMFAIETTDDGSSIVRTLKGSREVGMRLTAFVEVLGDDTKEGIKRVEEALDYLKEVVAERGRSAGKRKKA